jgi:hypothetical protein
MRHGAHDPSPVTYEICVLKHLLQYTRVFSETPSFSGHVELTLSTLYPRILNACPLHMPETSHSERHLTRSFTCEADSRSGGVGAAVVLRRDKNRQCVVYSKR